MATYTFDQLAALAQTHFGDLSGDVPRIMAAIAVAESGGVTDAVHDNYPADVSDPNSPARYDYGLWQINGANEPDHARLLADPDFNASVARTIYDAFYQETGNGFGAWAAYNNGAYRTYYDAQPAPAPTPNPGPAFDPYVGMAGLAAAWERFKYWLGVELPAQWDRINALMGLAAAGGTVNTSPPPPPPPNPTPTPIPPGDEMTVQVFGGGSDQNIDTGAARFWLPAYGNNNNSGTGWGSVIAQGGSIDQLIGSLSAAPGVGKSVTFTLMVNGVASALTCAVVDAATSASDTTHSVAVNAGDYISIRTTPAGTPTAARPAFAVQYTATSPTTSIWAGGGMTTQPFFTTDNAGGGSWFNGPLSSEALFRTVWPIDCTINALYVNLSSAPFTAQGYAVSIYRNGVKEATSTVSITGNTATAGNVTGLSIAVTAGDVIALEIVPGGNPATVTMGVGIAYTPATPGEYFINFLTTDVGSSPTPVYYGLNGQRAETGDVTEANKLEYIGAAAGSLSYTVRALYGTLLHAPGVGQSRTWTLRVNGADSNLAVTFGAADTAVHVAGGQVIMAGDLATMRTVGSGGAAATTRVSWGLAVGVPSGSRQRTLTGAGQ